MHQQPPLAAVSSVQALATAMADILTCYYRPKPGGLFARYLRAIEALLDAGHTVHYLALAPFPINHPNCHFHRFPWPADRSDTLLFWFCFFLMAPFLLLWIALRYRVRRAFCFDVAYAFCLQPLRIMGVATPACFVRGDAVAALEARKSPPWSIRLLSWMEAMALIDCRIVGSGAHLIDAIAARHPKLQLGKVDVLPNDFPVPVNPSRQALPGRLRAAMVGPLVPLKNQGFVLDMLRDAKAESIGLTLFGTGPEEANLKQKIHQYHLGDRTSLAGWVPVDKIWKQVDLLLAPSLNEGMPNAVLEALANGIPVLASDIPGHRMILPEPFCLPLSEPERWRRMLEELMVDTQRRLSAMHAAQMQLAGRLRFDWDAKVVDLIVREDRQSNLRILILGNAAPYRLGGAEVQTRRLADAFCQGGHRVTIAGYAMPNQPDGTLPWRSVNVRVRGGTRRRRAISFAFGLSRWLLRQRKSFDVIYSRVIGESILVAAVLKSMGIIRQPMVVSSACAGESGDAAALADLPGRGSIVRLVNRTCSAVNILSPKIEKELGDLGLRRDRFTYIPNGVPVSTGAPRERSDYDKQRTFLYVGRLSRQKRVDLLLLAFSRLEDSERGPSLHVVGDGPEKQALLSLAGRLGIAHRVVFYGKIDPEEVARHYWRHAIFILGSRDEGQPNALLEAMSNGMPAIVTASGGAEYLVDQTTGLICPPDDPDALSAAMSRMLEMPSGQLARMGESARCKVQSKFDLQQVAEQYLDLFKKLVGEADRFDFSVCPQGFDGPL